MRRFTPIGSAALLTSILIAGGSGIGSFSRSHVRAAFDATSLIYGATEEPDSLNPLITQLVVGGDVDSAVFDSFVGYDTSNRPYPILATSYTTSPDGLSWSFNLRHGVRWADGQPFSSADVLYTYRALFNKKNNVFGTQGWDKVDRITAPDAYTVKMHLKQTFAPFLSFVGVTSILPRHILDTPGVDFNKGPFNRTPMGTGPYMVSEWKTADHITLVPNPYSWRGQPFFKRLVYKIVPNSNTELVQLKTGDLDVGGVTAALADQATNIPGKTLIVSDANAWYHIDLKQYGFLREKAVRQALDYATPRDAIIKGILKGNGSPAYADIDPAFKDFFNPNMPRHPYSLARAAALLAADGFTKGPGGVLQKNGQSFDLALWTGTSDDTGQKIDTILKNLWGRLGINVTLHSQGFNTIFGASGPQFTRNMTGINFAWFNGNDPSDSFYWSSTQIPRSPTGSGGNDVGYFYQFDFQKQIDALVAAGDSTVDLAKRRQIYYQIQNILADEVPVLFLYWEKAFSVAPATLKNFKPNPFAHVFYNVVQWRKG